MKLDDLDAETRRQTGTTLGVAALKMLNPDLDDGRARGLLEQLAIGLDRCEKNRGVKVDRNLLTLAGEMGRNARLERSADSLAVAAVKSQRAAAEIATLRARVATLEGQLRGARVADSDAARLNRRRFPR